MNQGCSRLDGAFAARLAKVMVVVCGVVASARAEPRARDPVGAEALFRTAMDRLKAGDWPGACEQFHKSLELDPAVSTLAKIAQCHERDGKLAAAWYDYQRALKLLPEMDLSDRRRHELKERIEAGLAALEPRVPKLRIRVEPVREGLEVWRDGTPIPVAALGELLPVDPGEHKIAARLPGFREEHSTVMVPEGALSEATLTLTAILPAAVPVVPPPRSDHGRAQGPHLPETPDTATGPTPPPPDLGSPSSAWGQREAGWMVGGAGLLALGAATYFGLRTLSLVGQSDSHCDSHNLCYPEGLRLRRDANDAQTVGLVLAGVGASALGVGVVLFATAPAGMSPRPRAAGAPEIGAWIAPGGLLARGVW